MYRVTVPDQTMAIDIQADGYDIGSDNQLNFYRVIQFRQPSRVDVRPRRWFWPFRSYLVIGEMIVNQRDYTSHFAPGQWARFYRVDEASGKVVNFPRG